MCELCNSSLSCISRLSSGPSDSMSYWEWNSFHVINDRMTKWMNESLNKRMKEWIIIFCDHWSCWMNCYLNRTESFIILGLRQKAEFPSIILQFYFMQWQKKKTEIIISMYDFCSMNLLSKEKNLVTLMLKNLMPLKRNNPHPRLSSHRRCRSAERFVSSYWLWLLPPFFF